MCKDVTSLREISKTHRTLSFVIRISKTLKKEGKKRSTDSSIFLCRLEEKHYRSPGEIQSEPGYPLTTVAHPRSRESNNKRDYSDPTEIYGLAEPVEPGNHLRQIIISTRILPPRSFSKFSFFFSRSTSSFLDFSSRASPTIFRSVRSFARALQALSIP